MSRLTGARVGLLIATVVAGTAAGSVHSAAGSASPSPSVIPVLPGEEWIAYEEYGIHLVRPDETDDHLIAPEYSGNHSDWLQGAYNPDWSPDGSQITFLDSIHPGWPIMVADADGTNIHEVVPCGDGCQVLDAPAWSPDGRSIAYAGFEGEWPPDLYTSRYSIEILDLETGAQRTVVSFDATPGQPAIMYDYPRWSPDGSSLVIAVDQLDEAQTTHTASAIAVVDAQGPAEGTPRFLTGWGMWAAYPDWNRAQDLIVFSTHNWAEFASTDEASNLYTIRPDGTHLRQLTTYPRAGEKAVHPSFTPDGERIIFTHVDLAHGRGPDAAFIDVDGTDLEILNGPGLEMHPRLRPTP